MLVLVKEEIDLSIYIPICLDNEDFQAIRKKEDILRKREEQNHMKVLGWGSTGETKTSDILKGGFIQSIKINKDYLFQF